MIDKLNSILMTHGDVVPVNLKTLVVRTARRLSTEQAVFKLIGTTSPKMRIQGVLRVLAELSRAAEAGTSPSSKRSWP